MPYAKGYASKSQQRFMHAAHPKIAKRWDKETPDFSKLPEKKGKKGKRKHKTSYDR
jgi:hypothetical protein